MKCFLGGKSSITLTGGEDHTVYWKCETNQEIKEVLHMPLANIAKDKALITVAQQVCSVNIFYWLIHNLLIHCFSFQT